MGKGIENRGSQVHHVKRGDLLAEEHAKEIAEALDEQAIDELRLYIDNDEQLYRSQQIPILKNIQRRMKSGKYKHDLAPKLWQYLVDNGAKKYCKLFGGEVRYTFPKAEREWLAKDYADEYQDVVSHDLTYNWG